MEGRMNTDINPAGKSNLEEQLWNYIDGTASAEQKSVIEKQIEADAQWKNKYHELLELDKVLKLSELEAPSMRFSKNVMEEIARLHIAPATKTYINKKIIWSIGFFFIAIVIGFLVYGFGQMFAGANTGEESTISKN